MVQRWRLFAVFDGIYNFRYILFILKSYLKSKYQIHPPHNYFPAASLWRGGSKSSVKWLTSQWKNNILFNFLLKLISYLIIWLIIVSNRVICPSNTEFGLFKKNLNQIFYMKKRGWNPPIKFLNTLRVIDKSIGTGMDCTCVIRI